MKSQKGITLIALVITIIVLLILAGVSIAMLTGDNGILTQASRSKNETNRAEIAEKINIELNAFKADILADGKINDSTVTTANTALGSDYTISDTTSNPITITHNTETDIVGTIYITAIEEVKDETSGEVTTAGHAKGEIIKAEK